jgi:serine protease Do
MAKHIVSSRTLVALAVAGVLGTAALSPATPTLAQLGGGAPTSFADVAERVKPAVVSIHVKGGDRVAKAESRRQPGTPGAPGGPGARPPQIPDLPEDHPLHDFFKRFGEQFKGMPSPQQPRLAQGSGFFISADGYVVTNNHVVDGASKVEVALDDKEKYEADVIGTDQRTDLALLKIKGVQKSFAFVKLAAREPRVGDWVLAVGNPFGLGGTVTAGIVSALARDIGSGPYDFMQIDAAVNRGNSGGPTFNLAGEVVGVNTAIYSPSGGNVGIAFAVPAKLAAQVIEELKSKGTVSRGWLGVNIQNVTEDVAKGLGMSEPHGAIVSAVTANGPAAKAGLKEGDTIVAVSGQKVLDSRDLARKVAAMAPDASTDVRVIRDGSEKTIRVQLGTFPAGDKLAKLEQGSGRAMPEIEQFGLTLAPSTARRLPGPGTPAVAGVAITDVEANSEAASKGLRAGDVIVDVGGKAVTSIDEVTEGIKAAKAQGREAVLMRVRPGGDGNPRFVGLKFKKTG